VIMLSFDTSPDGKSCVLALSDFRRIALSMPDTEETKGMGYPNFRTGRKSFAAIEDSIAVIRLTRDQQATFVATAPAVFAPDSSGWGRRGNTVIRLEAADEATVHTAVATAWRNAAGVVNDSVEVPDVVLATDVIATVVKAVDVGEVADEASAAAFANVAEVAEGIASEIPNAAEVVEIENAAISVELRDHSLSAIPRQVANARKDGERSITLALVAVVKRENMIDLKFGEALDDPQPFVLTVTPGYVAHETAKTLPISASDLHAYILAHVAKLRATADNCKAGGLTSKILQ
jgi:hypothetical protein